jgi:hypothetical protein
MVGRSDMKASFWTGTEDEKSETSSLADRFST